MRDTTATQAASCPEEILLEMADILVADDEKGIREGVQATLECEGHSVRLARNGDEALAAYREKRPDLLLLDVMMPKKNGYDVISRIRREDPSLQVIFLSAKTREDDKVLGLNLGADDYIAKPFKPMELVARVETALRRSRLMENAYASTGPAAASAAQDAPAERTASPSAQEPPAIPPDAEFQFGSHRVDQRRHLLVHPGGKSEELGRREINILRLLASNPGIVLDRERFRAALWGDDYFGSDRTLDTYMYQLRRKLGADAACIETVVKSGYRYNASPQV